MNTAEQRAAIYAAALATLAPHLRRDWLGQVPRPARQAIKRGVAALSRDPDLAAAFDRVGTAQHAELAERLGQKLGECTAKRLSDFGLLRA